MKTTIFSGAKDPGEALYLKDLAKRFENSGLDQVELRLDYSEDPDESRKAAVRFQKEGDEFAKAADSLLNYMAKRKAEGHRDIIMIDDTGAHRFTPEDRISLLSVPPKVLVDGPCQSPCTPPGDTPDTHRDPGQTAAAE